MSRNHERAGLVLRDDRRNRIAFQTDHLGRQSRMKGVAPSINRVVHTTRGGGAKYVLGVLVVSFLLRTAIRVIDGQPPISFDVMSQCLGSGIGATLAWWTIDRRKRRAHASRMMDQCRKAQICAACGYDLAALSAQPDACRVCPECGAAWKC